MPQYDANPSARPVQGIGRWEAGRCGKSREEVNRPALHRLAWLAAIGTLDLWKDDAECDLLSVAC